MSANADWPELTWEDPPRSEWMLDRVHEMAARVRGFELSLEQGGEAGELDAGRAQAELEEWDRCAAEVFAHTAMGEGLPLPKDLARFGRQMRQCWDELGEIRERILDALDEEGAAALLDREAVIEVDRSLFRERPAELSDQAAFQRMTGEFPAVLDVPEQIEKPVTAEEVRMRTAAEQKLLPEKANLGALMALLPSDWVSAIFSNLELELDDDEEMTAGSRSAARRGVIHRSLMDAAFLEEVVDSLGPDERALLGEILAAGGTVPYRRITEEYGLDEADGFYWSERPPSGTLACLRRMGLAYVGVRKSVPAVAVPADLAPRLQELLSREGSAEPTEAT